MVKKYECNIVTMKDGHTYAECNGGDEDWYMVEPDFNNFPQGGLAIVRQFGPNETEDEGDKNVLGIVIEERYIVDELKDFLGSTRNEMESVHRIRKGYDITYRFKKESHGWLRIERVYSQDGNVNTIDLLMHKDVVPIMKQIVDQNFT